MPSTARRALSVVPLAVSRTPAPSSMIDSTLALVAFSHFNGTLDGNVFVFFILTIAAAEVAVGLAIIVALFRKRHTVQLEELNHLKH